MFWGHVFGVGWCNAFVCSFNKPFINCFGKIRVILTRTYESAVVLKRTFYSSGPEKDVL